MCTRLLSLPRGILRRGLQVRSVCERERARWGEELRCCLVASRSRGSVLDARDRERVGFWCSLVSAGDGTVERQRWWEDLELLASRETHGMRERPRH
jgi:hypothetical protein